jgi:hypothetical protein
MQSPKLKLQYHLKKNKYFITLLEKNLEDENWLLSDLK